MEKIPVIDPKAGQSTPVPVKGVDLQVGQEVDTLAQSDGGIPPPRGNENEQDFAENEGLVARRLRESEGAVAGAEGEDLRREASRAAEQARLRGHTA